MTSLTDVRIVEHFALIKCNPSIVNPLSAKEETYKLTPSVLERVSSVNDNSASDALFHSIAIVMFASSATGQTRSVDAAVPFNPKIPHLNSCVLTLSDRYVQFYVVCIHTDEQVFIGNDKYISVPCGIVLVTRLPSLLNLYRLGCKLAFCLSSFPCRQDPESVSDIKNFSPNNSTSLSSSSVRELLSFSLCGIPSCETFQEVVICDLPEVQGKVVKSVPLEIPYSSSLLKTDFRAFFALVLPEIQIELLNLLLGERKILIYSYKIPEVVIVMICEAVRSILFPFEWLNLYCPGIPLTFCKDALRAPWLVLAGVRLCPGDQSIESLRSELPSVHFLNLDSQKWSHPEKNDSDAGFTGEVQLFPEQLAEILLLKFKELRVKELLRLKQLAQKYQFLIQKKPSENQPVAQSPTTNAGTTKPDEAIVSGNKKLTNQLKLMLTGASKPSAKLVSPNPSAQALSSLTPSDAGRDVSSTGNVVGADDYSWVWYNADNVEFWNLIDHETQNVGNILYLFTPRTLCDCSIAFRITSI